MPTLLLLAASPLDQDRLRLNHEVKKIKHALERSQNREQWEVQSNEAVTVDDLRRQLLDCKPTIVHFCGHGAGEGGLRFEDDEGNTHLTQAAPLARLFHHFREQLQCVVLNACYSDIQGEAIRQEIDYVVGMKTAIQDEPAIQFAVAFYDAIFAGTGFQAAFDLGCLTIDLHNLPDSDVPVFLTSPRLGKVSLQYTANVPAIENLLLAYLNTPFSERHIFTTKGDKLAPIMTRHYGDQMLKPRSKVTVISKKRLDECHWKVHVCVFGEGKQDYSNFYLRIDGRVIKVDWEASVGYWSKPIKTYLALGTDSPIIARVSVELGDFYSGQFYDNQVVYQNVHLRNVGGHALDAYVPRFTSTYQELMEIIEDGNSHDLTLAIINKNQETKHPVVMKVLSRSWILADASPHSEERLHNKT